MSLPSFKLSKGAGGSWWAEGVLPSGRPFKFDAGKGSRDRAEGVAEMRLKAKMASSAGSRAHWARIKAGQAAPPRAAAPAPAAASSSSDPPTTNAPPSSTPRRDPAEIRAKLLSLGDASSDAGASASASSSSSEPAPEVIPPGAPREEPGEPLDDEGGELLASLIAAGVCFAFVEFANYPLKKRKPPMRGEPHEKGLEYTREGVESIAKRVVGKTTTLTDWQKIILGGLIIVGSVRMTAEPIPGAAAAEEKKPPPAPAPDAAASGSSSNGVHDQGEETALVPAASPLGVFGSH